MKTAVLVYGEFREFENSHKSWNFLKLLDYDIYFSTWNTSVEKNEFLKYDVSDVVTEDKILKYFPNAIINIEEPFWSSPPSKVTHHWRKLFNMVQMSNKNYDIIILIRPDIYLKELHHSFNEVLTNINDERIIYGLSNIQSQKPPIFLFVADCMWVGKTKLMEEIFLSFPPPDITRKNIHYHLSKHFINNDVYVENIHGNIFDYFIMRGVNRLFLDKSYDEQKKIAEDWWYSKHHNFVSENIRKLLNL